MKLQNAQLTSSINVSVSEIVCSINLVNNELILVTECQILSAKGNDATESPRMREFKKKLKERTPIGILLYNKTFFTKM